MSPDIADCPLGDEIILLETTALDEVRNLFSALNFYMSLQNVK